MNSLIHPDLTVSIFICSTCGTSFELASTGAGQLLEVCSSCHPAYMGRERAPESGSRIERFERRLQRAAV
jgi:large subunit ribosomal protein L31